MQRAVECLADADASAHRCSWNNCVNRLYYTCFYAVSALLLRDGLASAKHTGVRSLFNERFVRTGIVAQDLGILYNDLFRDRQEADYADLIDFNEQQVLPLIAEVRQFVASIELLLS
ncbi:MAG: HEPN domain-containing protein [Chloroflexota bacterium]|nr:HEPN domain-containing protein [Chloroflexota bacterium]